MQAATTGVRLNLGAGAHPLDGYENLDRATGQEIYPLPHADGTVAEIRASHVLEHFSHREVPAVLADWVRALEPGGRLAVAVPDFEVVARAYLSGAQLPTEAYVMGGHVDGNDRHGAIFDEESLRDHLRRAGLHGVQRWQSSVADCASLPVSLNLVGWKAPAAWPTVSAVMSCPRLGFMDNFFCAFEAFAALRIPFRRMTGAFWGQCLTRAMQQVMDQDAPDYILTLDYDSVFTQGDVEGLLSAAMRNPDADAIAPIQAARTRATPLFTLADEAGASRGSVDRDEFAQELVRAKTAHFGLTLIKTAALRDLPAPWFHGQPDPDGGWGEKRIDDDIAFWYAWRDAGKSLYVCPRVAIGHAELMIRWPDRNMSATYQHPTEFSERGKPDEVWR